MFLAHFPAGSFWVFRDQFTKDDIKVYAAVLEKPGDAFPNVGKWYEVVSSKLAARFVLLHAIEIGCLCFDPFVVLNWGFICVC